MGDAGPGLTAPRAFQRAASAPGPAAPAGGSDHRAAGFPSPLPQRCTSRWVLELPGFYGRRSEPCCCWQLSARFVALCSGSRAWPCMSVCGTSLLRAVCGMSPYSCYLQPHRRSLRSRAEILPRSRAEILPSWVHPYLLQGLPSSAWMFILNI